MLRAPRLTSALLLALFCIAIPARVIPQEPAAQRAVVVTADGTAMHLQVWRPASGGYERIWDAYPLAAPPPQTGAAQQPVMLATGLLRRDATMAIADCDGDGANDLIVMDALGITMYGRHPAYHSFELVAESLMQTLVAADIDADDRVELVTQRGASISNDTRDLEVFRVGEAGFTSVWKQQLRGWPQALAVGDIDNDKENEILAASTGTVGIFERKPEAGWEMSAEMPTIGGAMAMTVADVDGDGKNELIVAGNSGKVTVYKHKKVTLKDTYPVLWQSVWPLPAGTTSTSRGYGPWATVLGLAVADVDGDKKPEIVVGTSEEGRVDGKDIGGDKEGGRLFVYKFNGQSDFTSQWTSPWIDSAMIGGVAAGDVDGDAVAEIVLNGAAVYKRDVTKKTYAAVASVCGDCRTGVVGALGELRAPAAATRLVPLDWNVGRRVAEGQTLDGVVSLRSPWTEARNVTLIVTSTNPGIEVSNGVVKVTSIPAGGVAALPPFKVTGRKAGTYAPLRFDVVADGGYRQSFFARLVVSSRLPTYEQAAERPIAEALATARDQNQRVLVAWGSNADEASRVLVDASARDSDLMMKLLYEYVVVRAEATPNRQLASKYGALSGRASLPFLTVLDGSGKVLANQALAPYRADAGGRPTYDTKRLVEFLTKHEAPKEDANAKLAAALGRAKAESKTPFIWFSSPG